MPLFYIWMIILQQSICNNLKLYLMFLFVSISGFNPVWNETLTFDIQVPELAIVWFRVMDYESYSSNVLVCQYALPFPSLMPGKLARIVLIA